MKKLNILLLCNRPVRNADASTVVDHLDAFSDFSRHNIFHLSFLRRLPRKLHLDRFDVVILHYSIALGFHSEHFIDLHSKQRIREFTGLKVVFIQDEYRAVDVVIEALRFMKTDVLFTCVPNGEIDKVYSPSILPGLKKINNLTGYVLERLTSRKVPAIIDRTIDVGYRTRKLPYWLGELGFEKWDIAVQFLKHTSNYDLQTDISCEESDRIYGEKWIEFITSCKAMLGVESGASVFDFSGELQRAVDQYQAEHPDADFAEAQEKFLKPYEGKIRLNQISPRCFETAALRTVMLLYEGEYSGILKPWRHYIPLRKDFSNIDEVLRVLKDTKKLKKIADIAYQEIALNPKYSYKTFIENFDRVVESEMKESGKISVKRPYSKSSYYLDLAFSPGYVFYRSTAMVLQRLILGTYLRKSLYKLWAIIPLNARLSVRPFLRIIGR